MLVSIYDLSGTEMQELKTKLNAAFETHEVKKRFNKSLTTEVLMKYPQRHEMFFTETFISITNERGICGIFNMEYTISNDNVIECISFVMINLTPLKLTFGRDQRTIYDHIVNISHRVNVTALVDHITTNQHDGSYTNKHWKRYGIRYIGRKEYVVLNANNDWMDEMLWEIITPKGYEYINNSTKLC